MSIQERYSAKLNEMLFLTLNNEKVYEIFNFRCEEEIYIPIQSKEIIDKVKNNDYKDELSITSFIEGMFYVLGIDKKFKYNEYYKEIIKNNENAIKFIKGKIYEAVKEEKYEHAYILLLGLIEVEENQEIYDKLFLVVNILRGDNRNFNEDMVMIIEKAKKIDKYTKPYIEEALLYNDLGEYERAISSIEKYFQAGGEHTEVADNLNSLTNGMVKYRKGKEMVYDNPKEALGLLIPLQDFFKDNALLLYYIAICYRLLNNYEKAIYYLNDAMAIDNNYVEFLNEYGLNYSHIGDFQTAIKYFKEAFKMTNSIEICTNIVMCYIQSNDIVNAKKYLKIARSINSEDEVILEIEQSYNLK